MAFSSVSALISSAQNTTLWEAVMAEDIQDRGVTLAQSTTQMTQLWHAMKESVSSYDTSKRSTLNLTGGDGGLVETQQVNLLGSLATQVMATAMKVGESNACMGRIVAAPTAGASGVIPAIFVPFQSAHNWSDQTMVEGLYVASGFGQVIATRASISGAEGGCQAEIGSASAMAAAALVSLMGGTPEQMATACGTALQNLMGLACDPVAGLVELPCIKRNVIGAMNAISAAELALAGATNVIPCDEVIDAMAAVGNIMPESLRETGTGGLAATPTGRRIYEELQGH